MSFAEVMCDPCSTVSQAARIGDLHQLLKLVAEGHPLDVSDNRGWKALHEACYGNHLDCVRELLKPAVTDVNWVSHDGVTSLLLACQERHVDCAHMLLGAGADPDLSDHVDNYPLLEAVKGRSLALVELLVEHGANVDCQLYCGTSPLHHAASEGMAGILSYLLQRGARLDIKEDRHAQPITSAHVLHLQRHCLQHGARLDIKEDYDITPIFSAAHHGQLECLRLLIQHAVDKDQKWLINYPAEDGATPLYLAAQEGHTECVKTLLQHGADANISTNNEPRALPLLAAIEFAHLECIAALMPQTDSRFFTDCDTAPWYTLFCCGDHKLRHQMARILLDGGLDPNYQHSKDLQDNYTRFPKILRFLPTQAMLFYKSIRPLTKASYFESAQHPSRLISLLIERGAYLNAQSLYEMAPIIPALENAKTEIIRTHLSHDVCVDIYHPKVQGNLTILLSMHRWKIFIFLVHIGAEIQSIFDMITYSDQLENYKNKLCAWRDSSKDCYRRAGCPTCKLRKIETDDSDTDKAQGSSMPRKRPGSPYHSSDESDSPAWKKKRKNDRFRQPVSKPRRRRRVGCQGICGEGAEYHTHQEIIHDIVNYSCSETDSDGSDDDEESESSSAEEEEGAEPGDGHICGGAQCQQDIIDSMTFLPFSTFLMGARQVMSGRPHHVNIGQVLLRLVYYAGTVTASQAMLAYTDNAEQRDELLEVTSSARSLKHLCRVTIRQCLGPHRLYNQHTTRLALPLPREITDYVFVKEMEDSIDLMH